MYMNYQLANTLYSVELTPAHYTHESHHWHYIASSLFSLLRFIISYITIISYAMVLQH